MFDVVDRFYCLPRRWQEKTEMFGNSLNGTQILPNRNYINRIDRITTKNQIRFVDTHTHWWLQQREKKKFKAAAIERFWFSWVWAAKMVVRSVCSNLISVVCAISIVAAADSTEIAENCPATIENACQRCARYSFYGRGEWNEIVLSLFVRCLEWKMYFALTQLLTGRIQRHFKQMYYAVHVVSCVCSKFCAQNCWCCIHSCPMQVRTHTSRTRITLHTKRRLCRAKCHSWNFCAATFCDFVYFVYRRSS